MIETIRYNEERNALSKFLDESGSLRASIYNPLDDLSEVRDKTQRFPLRDEIKVEERKLIKSYDGVKK